MPATRLAGDVRAHLAVPPIGDGPWPGVVVLHEAFGLNDDIRQQADRLAAAGYDAILVGEALVTAEDPAERLRELVAAGRAVVGAGVAR